MQQPWTQDNKKRNSGNTALLQVTVEELAVFQIIKVFFPVCQICLCPTKCVIKSALSSSIIASFASFLHCPPFVPSYSPSHKEQTISLTTSVFMWLDSQKCLLFFFVKQFNLMTFTVATVFACQQLVNGHV